MKASGPLRLLDRILGSAAIPRVFTRLLGMAGNLCRPDTSECAIRARLTRGGGRLFLGIRGFLFLHMPRRVGIERALQH